MARSRKTRKQRKQKGRGAAISTFRTPEQRLHAAFQARNFEECERLLATGANINSTITLNNMEDYTVTLFWYVRDEAMLNFLRDHRFDWNTRNNRGETSAIIACGEPTFEGYDDIVLDLLGQDADWSIVSNDGSTPLIMAAKYGLVDALDYILDWGSDGILIGVGNMSAYVNMRDNDGKSAYDYMEDYNNNIRIRDEMLQKLRNLGAEGSSNLEIENIGEKTINTKEPSNVYTHNNIKNGNNMVNFNDEFKYGRYYTKASFNTFPKVNPYSRKKIRKAYTYKAKLAPAAPTP